MTNNFGFFVINHVMLDSTPSRLSREHLHASAGLFERRRSGRHSTFDAVGETFASRSAFEKAVAVYNKRVSLRAFKLQTTSVSDVTKCTCIYST